MGDTWGHLAASGGNSTGSGGICPRNTRYKYTCLAFWCYHDVAIEARGTILLYIIGYCVIIRLKCKTITLIPLPIIRTHCTQTMNCHLVHNRILYGLSLIGNKETADWCFLYNSHFLKLQLFSVIAIAPVSIAHGKSDSSAKESFLQEG